MQQFNTLGEIPIIPHIRGDWALTMCPYPRFINYAGRSYELARWRWPYKDVVAQYREMVPFNARHLKVFADGTFVIDHLDEANPDRGQLVRHFFKDTKVGKFIKAVPCCTSRCRGRTSPIPGLVIRSSHHPASQSLPSG